MAYGMFPLFAPSTCNWWFVFGSVEGCQKRGMNDKEYHFRVRVVISITITYTYLGGVFKDIVSLLG